MTIDEVFPRSQFPLRAQTEIKLPRSRKNVVRKVRIFYQVPGKNLAEQRLGWQISLYLVGGKKRFSLAVRPTHMNELNRGRRGLGEGGLYIVKNRNFIPASEEELNTTLLKDKGFDVDTCFGDRPAWDDCVWTSF